MENGINYRCNSPVWPGNPVTFCSWIHPKGYYSRIKTGMTLIR